MPVDGAAAEVRRLAMMDVDAGGKQAKRAFGG